MVRIGEHCKLKNKTSRRDCVHGKLISLLGRDGAMFFVFDTTSEQQCSLVLGCPGVNKHRV